MTDEPVFERLPGHSPDLTQRNVVALAELFPTVVTETLDADGNPTSAINFDQLRQELADHVVEGPQERYELNWPGKREAAFTANAPIAKTLRPDRAESVDFDTTKNIFIEGDNLDALKLLQESYLGKVKLIYIDPPYNTGNDFIYDDDFAETRDEYLERSGQSNGNGERLVANTESNGRFHSDWLSMMYSGLKLARNLLADDGVIFISIDDGEYSNIKNICDELFSTDAFIGTFVWEKRTTRENRKSVSTNHDYVIAYARIAHNTNSLAGLPFTQEALERYQNPDNDSRGPWQSVAITAQAGHGTTSQFYEITLPDGRCISPPSGNCWRYTKPKFQELVDDNRIWFGKSGSNIPRLKLFIADIEQSLTPHTLWKAEESGTNDLAKRELNQLFSGQAVFDTPKPLPLLRRLIELGARPGKSICLDFFAGSGSLAHAVYEVNATDNGDRTFISIQLPENIESENSAPETSFETISQISRERIRRAGKKVREEAGLTGDDLDIGFRAFTIDTTNFEDVLRTPDRFNQADAALFEDNIKPDRTNEDLLFQVLLGWGLTLDLPIRRLTLGDDGSLVATDAESLVSTGSTAATRLASDTLTVFDVDNGALLACLDSEVSKDVVNAMARHRTAEGLAPTRVVFRDSAFLRDDDRINARQVFTELSPNTTVKTI